MWKEIAKAVLTLGVSELVKRASKKRQAQIERAVEAAIEAKRLVDEARVKASIAESMASILRDKDAIEAIVKKARGKK